MNFELDPKYLEIQQQARELARSIEPLAVEADESSEVHAGVLDALRSSGLPELMVTTEYGGRFERLDPLAEVLSAAGFEARPTQKSLRPIRTTSC